MNKNNLINNNIYNKKKCESVITKYLKYASEKINPFFNYFDMSQYDIISLGLILNGICIINLLENRFYLFILFLILGHLCNVLNVLYVKQYNKPTEYGNNYNNMSNWFKIILMAQIFYEVYKKKINDELLITILILFVFCNINYSIKNCMKLKNGKTVDYYMEIWTAPICKLKYNTLEKWCQFTKYFDENMIFLYMILLLIYIHFK